MPYMPAAASLATARKGKIKNICSTTLRETKEEHNPQVVIINFEKEAMAYDRQQVLKTGSAGMFNITENSQYTPLERGYIIHRRPHGGLHGARASIYSFLFP